MIAQNEVNAQGGLANKAGNYTVRTSIVMGGFLHKTNNGNCTIIQDARMGEKHI